MLNLIGCEHVSVILFDDIFFDVILFDVSLFDVILFGVTPQILESSSSSEVNNWSGDWEDGENWTEKNWNVKNYKRQITKTKQVCFAID
jgi:hypothetical protein